jgi:hypothetical protein
MADLAWLSGQAHALHAIFSGVFYGIVGLLLTVGVVVEYFRLPLGGLPTFSALVGRALVASILLKSYPEIANAVASVSEALASRIGDLNQFQFVLAKMGEKLDGLSASWLGIKETVVLAISFLAFFGLYFSVFIAEGIYLFTWMICYVLSPILIAFFVLPRTAGCTSALFRTIFEVSCWKIVWSVLAALLWSSALMKLDATDVNFASLICFNLTLAGSLLLTPWVVHSLATSGLAGFTNTLGSIAVGAVAFSPGTILRTVRRSSEAGIQRVRQVRKAYLKRHEIKEGKV